MTRRVSASKLEAALRRSVIGQSEAITAIIEAYRLYLSGLSDPNRPVSTLMFLGPTGCGKTRTIEVLAETLYGSPKAYLKIDCGEYHDHHEVAKLIGSPPGYLGHRETQPLLHQRMLNEHLNESTRLSIVLFDEIEKAHPRLWDLLLAILDKGTLRLGDNSTTDFTGSLIVLTGNVGAHQIQSRLGSGFGFSDPSASGTAGVHSVTMSAARRAFSPEFLNRIDRIVVFRPLDRADLERICELELEMVQARIPQIRIRVSRRGRERLIEEGYDPRYGARHLRRTIHRRIVHRLAERITEGETKTGDTVTFDWDGEQWSAETSTAAAQSGGNA